MREGGGSGNRRTEVQLQTVMQGMGSDGRMIADNSSSTFVESLPFGEHCHEQNHNSSDILLYQRRLPRPHVSGRRFQELATAAWASGRLKPPSGKLAGALETAPWEGRRFSGLEIWGLLQIEMHTHTHIYIYIYLYIYIRIHWHMCFLCMYIYIYIG